MPSVGSPLRCCFSLSTPDSHFKPMEAGMAATATQPRVASSLAPRRFTRSILPWRRRGFSMRTMRSNSSTAPSSRCHPRILYTASRLRRRPTFFIRALNDRPYFVQSQSTLPLDELNVPQPDLAVARPTTCLGRIGGDLVVEVADTSPERDRSTKQALYSN
jgi:hypothetical protein